MGLKVFGRIIGLASKSTPMKNIYRVSNPIKSGSSHVDEFTHTAGRIINREEILAKICTESSMAAEEVLQYVKKGEESLGSSIMTRLLELAGKGEIKLCTPIGKKKPVFIMNRNANDGLLIKEPEGVLNYISGGDTGAVNLLKELAVLEKEGKITAENISQLQKMHKAGYQAECAEFISKLKAGEVTNENVQHALLMVENEIPFEVFNPQNLSKFSKDDLREFALTLQACRGNMSPSLLNSVSRELTRLVKVNKVSQSVSSGFIRNFDNIAETIGKSNKTIEELSQAGGIRLSYTRDSFKANIFEIIKHLPESEQAKILEKFGLQKHALGIGNMKGLPIYLEETSSLSKTELAINNEIGKFLNQNSITLPEGFEEFKPALDEICKTFPEFIFTIGSKQHATHKLSLAEHILSAFQHNIQNPLYKELSASDKRVLGIATILHDINKTEKTIDKAHPLISSHTVDAIVHRMDGLTITEKNRIINLVENHHWLERVGDNMSEQAINELAFTFRSGNDFRMAKIFAESDLKAVNAHFYTAYGSKINSSATEEIEKAILALQSKGRMVYTTDVTLARGIEAGAELRTIGNESTATRNYVISARQLGLNTENFVYHAGDAEGLICAAASAGHKKGLVLSTSLGREGHLATYRNKPEFIGFRQINMNNIASTFVQNTKYGKSYNKFEFLYRGEGSFPRKVKENLSYEISDEQYARIFQKASGIRLNEIHSNREIQNILGGEKQALEFENAVKKINTELESSLTNFEELVICDPEVGFIGTKRAVENMDYNLRKFCEENNILIVTFN